MKFYLSTDKLMLTSTMNRYILPLPIFLNLKKSLLYLSESQTKSKRTLTNILKLKNSITEFK